MSVGTFWQMLVVQTLLFLLMRITLKRKCQKMECSETLWKRKYFLYTLPIPFNMLCCKSLRTHKIAQRNNDSDIKLPYTGLTKWLQHSYCSIWGGDLAIFLDWKGEEDQVSKISCSPSTLMCPSVIALEKSSCICNQFFKASLHLPVVNRVSCQKHLSTSFPKWLEHF